MIGFCKVAVAVPKFDKLRQIAEQIDPDCLKTEKWFLSKKINQFIMAEIRRLAKNAKLPAHEAPQAVVLTNRQFTAE